ncbi:uncharacterized protein LOC123402198 isoform X3 [Hordeum vulgare subsp. vulgare]|uniref:uncharacterized protein LOC123402198 isoform X3 n=1 Tax=Hordeum vulgare subsp. vulgare TaxID=112509 RepID=UPI001D1A4A23|nr:uncharacterized protein LOC123402198 isoform X3 [Hordeum vulgare subsp. vulgare]XP_044952016.1 uncharacterized protein LOC123402198 isoform X3 [Hordeum vulgare subsp. vulgare]
MSTQSMSPASASPQFPYPATAAAAATAPSYFPVPFHLQTSQYPTWPTVAPAQPAPAYNAVYPMPQVQQGWILPAICWRSVLRWSGRIWTPLCGFRGLGGALCCFRAQFGRLSSASRHKTSTLLPYIGSTAQQLFQRDLQIISPEALATVKAAIADNDKDKKVEANKKAVPRKAAGQCWEDPTLAEWPESRLKS